MALTDEIMHPLQHFSSYFLLSTRIAIHITTGYSFRFVTLITAFLLAGYRFHGRGVSGNGPLTSLILKSLILNTLILKRLTRNRLIANGSVTQKTQPTANA